MLNRFYSDNEAYIIDYRPIITLLEEALDARTNGNNVFSKEVQAEIDHIQSLLQEYENILEDIESEGGITTRAEELDRISTEAVQLLYKLKVITEIESSDLLEPIAIAEIEGENNVDADDDFDEGDE